MSVNDFDIREALRERARARRVDIMDSCGLSSEEASVMATLDVAEAEIVALTKRAEAAEAKLRDVAYWHEAWKEAEAEREALRQDAALLAALQPNARGRVGAALAVQPTTGDKHE